MKENLEIEYHMISLRSMNAKTLAEREQAEADRRQFEKKYPDFADELYFRARTEY